MRPDGKISTPLVEDMVAVGKTPSQLARDIEMVLAEYIRSPQVNVILTNAVSTFTQVRVLGQVVAPQAVPYREGMTVLDAVLAVGGLGEFAAGNRGKIVRVVEGKQQEIKVRIGDLVNKGDVSQNVPLAWRCTGRARITVLTRALQQYARPFDARPRRIAECLALPLARLGCRLGGLCAGVAGRFPHTRSVRG